MTKNRFFILCAVFTFVSAQFSAFALMPQTEKIIDGFLNLHAELTAEESNEIARSKIESYFESAKNLLPNEDAEQGMLLLDSLHLMESEPYPIDGDDPKAKNRAFGEQMKKNEAFISAHEDDGSISKWLYLFTGDVTSYYMTRSVASTFRHGMRVKKLYELALKKDPLLTNANINIGNWYFYAPRIFGGGTDKAGDCYELAHLSARTKGERYMSALVLSQFFFCEKQNDQYESLMNEAKKEVPNSKEIARIKKFNAQGISLFEYNRKKSGVDEHQEDED